MQKGYLEDKSNSDRTFSPESRSTSNSSVFQALQAQKDFRIHILNDEQLKPLLEIARENIDFQTFKIELHGLLRTYSRNLHKEAKVPAENLAIRIVRRYRRKIAHHLADDLYKNIPIQNSQNEIELSLKRTISNESSEDDEVDDEAAEDFQDVKDFLVNSQAFRILKSQLIHFLENSGEPKKLNGYFKRGASGSIIRQSFVFSAVVTAMLPILIPRSLFARFFGMTLILGYFPSSLPPSFFLQTNFQLIES